MNEPAITQARGAFSLYCRVELTVRARAERVWALLIDGPGFPRWNSTVTRIEGQIRDGERLRVHVPGTGMVFSPRVSDVVACEHMTWTGGSSPVFKGVRVFELRRGGNGTTGFSMVERFSGLLIPFVRGSMPDLGPVFARYAEDLRREAEKCGD